jgi:steroid delta-isomerase-like uncharacterized protein
MNEREMRDLLDRFWNDRDLDAADEFVADDFHGHMLGLGDDLHGRNEYKGWAGEVFEMFPDMELEFDPMFSGADIVAGKWTLEGTHEGDAFGIEASGESIRMSGLFIDRIEDGKVVEMWHEGEDLEMLQQAGVIPEMTAD